MKERIDALLPIVGGDDGCSPFDDFMKEDLKNRVLLINDSITELIIDQQVMCILRWNAEDRDLPIDKRKPITMYINSQGGNLFDGQALIDVMLYSKTPIRTVCLGMAASMAYLIFIAGHERIAFPNSCLLMHEGNQEISNSSSKTRDVMAFFDKIEERTKAYVVARTKIDPDLYDSVYTKEYWMYANQKGKELGVVDKIVGEDCDIDILF